MGRSPRENLAADRQPREPTYTAEELAQAAGEVYHTRPECVAAALRLAGIRRATKAEAGRIIHNYLTKEVK